LVGRLAEVSALGGEPAVQASLPSIVPLSQGTHRRWGQWKPFRGAGQFHYTVARRTIPA